MYLSPHSDHGLRAAETQGGKTAVREEKLGEEDPYRDATLREGEESHGTMIYLTIINTISRKI